MRCIFIKKTDEAFIPRLFTCFKMCALFRAEGAAFGFAAAAGIFAANIDAVSRAGAVFVILAFVCITFHRTVAAGTFAGRAIDKAVLGAVGVAVTKRLVIGFGVFAFNTNALQTAAAVVVKTAFVCFTSDFCHTYHSFRFFS